MSIQAIDTEWLLWANGHHSPLMDSLMWQASQPLTWLPLYALLIVALALLFPLHKSLRSWLPFVGALLTFGAAAGLADFISSGLLKPLFERPRPTHTEELAPLLHLLNGYTGGPFGFPSSHAANTSAVTLLFALFFGCESRRLNRPARVAGWSLTGLLILGYWLPNCWSRMYLGVHYPTDLLVGSLIGCLTALCAFFLWRAILRKIN